MSDAPTYHYFPSTHWSLVAGLGDHNTQVHREVLTELLRRYLPALRSYLVHVRGIPRDQADDLLQSFVLSKVLEGQLLSRADRERGKFRTLLLTSLNHFLISQHRHDSARKRQPSEVPASLGDIPEPLSPSLRPEEAFDLLWAREILAEAIRQMENECQRTQRGDIWGVFKHRILAEVVPKIDALPYEQLVTQYALKSPAHASNLVITGKRMLARILRKLVKEYEPQASDVDDEITQLRDILICARR